MAAAGEGVRDLAGLVPLAPGTRVHGTITGIVDYGAFLVTDDGRRGLIHISEISDWYVERAEDYFYKGERVQVEVVHFDPNSGKYAFSTRRLGGKQPLANRYADRLLELHRHGVTGARYRYGTGWARRPHARRTGRPGPAAGATDPQGSTGGSGYRLPGGTSGDGRRGPGAPRSLARQGSDPAGVAGTAGNAGHGSAGHGSAGNGPRAGGSGNLETAGGAARPATGSWRDPDAGRLRARYRAGTGWRSAAPVAGEDRESREALLQLLRHHVGQVSPAACTELDRLVETYGSERVATALARVLEETDRALQVIEATGRRLASGTAD
ncbi:S1 RNA-binding domain-containing protein [Thermaerobacter sp. PB12/4term]|uniref:S1 RNA-binding domain-containing protein n=1 Tax=Thermaerobacter sp. PB12/4term TaxID=2293838 RepID=UPI001313EEA1|nr:S1 RNA-binding domain-containing protein [Thermaerobacter sp. PB12/4term]QIA26243.1 S1 RNA-binding domain-containing protein [Thermaerobacter sp. PB12/4term]